jgi:hypothetical protein
METNLATDSIPVRIGCPDRRPRSRPCHETLRGVAKSDDQHDSGILASGDRGRGPTTDIQEQPIPTGINTVLAANRMPGAERRRKESHSAENALN